MNTVNFTFENRLTEDTNESVLIFLLPMNPSMNSTLTPWQVLQPEPEGGTISFTYKINLQVAVISEGDDSKMSPKTDIASGQVLDAKYTSDGDLILSNNPDTSRIAPQQAGVVNKTGVLNETNNPHPPVLLRTEWFVNGNPITKVSGLNVFSINIFQLDAGVLYFCTASSTQQSFNYTLQSVLAQTKYVIPDGITSVMVQWLRPDGKTRPDKFLFDPPSANG